MDVISLSEMLAGARPDAHCIAFRDRRCFTLARWRGDIIHNAQRLLTRDVHSGALFCEDGYSFMVGLFALIKIGADVIVPPNARAGTLRDLESEFDILVTDSDSADIENKFVIETHETDAAPMGLDVAHRRVDFFTSGSTGEMKRVPKTLENFEREAATLEGLWGPRLGDAQIFGTVTHQHVFGMTFRLMWPLLAGRPFCSEAHIAWEPLLAQLKTPAVVVSSPAHLTRLGGLAPLAAGTQPRMVVTAGAALPERAAIETAEIFGRAPTEIFGSTEAGVIAWRESVPGPVLWQPIPGVEVGSGVDGVLLLRSPHASEQDWCEQADRISFAADGRFRLEGRLDRVIKVEGKRVSLDRLESAIIALPWVEEAAVVSLGGDWQYLGAVARLSPAGNIELTRLGKFRFERRLRHELGLAEEPAVLPRRWRFVEAIPIDGLGKRRNSDLQALFEKGGMIMQSERTAGPDVKDPVVIDITRSEGRVDLTLTIPEELVYFRGHFPGFAVLPGVIQLDWALSFGKRYLPLQDASPQTVRVKFRKLIQAGDRVTLGITHLPARNRIEFIYSSMGDVCSSGQIGFLSS
jgi:acyl-coenzyme A synthetase/AMP-(fatty) acid ligase/3-hydroxymyristoyl/3-hydroxydecanoyl-(acyl carrier protein) dehydratase